MSHTEQAVRAGLTFTPEYFRAIRRDAQGPEKIDPSTDYPAPVHTSRDPWPAGKPVPGPVASLRERAERAGWAVRVMYSRGQHPHGTTGQPTAVSDWYGVQALHPESRARMIAVYCGKSSSWSSVHLLTRSEMTTRGSITDASAFLDLAGRVLDLRAWVLTRIAERAKVAASKPKSGARVKSASKREHGG